MRAGHERPGSRPLVALATGATAPYVLFIAGSAFAADGRAGFTLFDDAMISMRYARNLAEGHGLVWNVGERVEGYTKPLWMAAIHACGVGDDRVSPVVMISGVAILPATAGVAAAVAGDLFQSAGVASATFALVAFNYAPAARVDHPGLWQALADHYPDTPPLPEDTDAAGHE